MRIVGFIILFMAIPANLFIRTRLPRSNRMASIWPDLKIYCDPKFALCCGGIFFMEYSVLVPLTYIASYATFYGQASSVSYTLQTLINAGSILGRLVPGFACDKMGRFNCIIITVGLRMVSVLRLWLPAGGSKPLLYAFAAILGFASGGNVSFLPVSIGQLCDSTDYGRHISSATLIASFGTLTGIPPVGVLLRIENQTWG
jgi:predicted MFS family arabinose efflux permease